MNLIEIVFWIVVGLLIGYLLWGQTYSELSDKYQQLSQNYNQLNQNYVSLQQNYTQLSQECGQALQKYEACIGRETFFNWVSRLSSLGGLAKLLGLI